MTRQDSNQRHEKPTGSYPSAAYVSEGPSGGMEATLHRALCLMAADYLESEGKVGVDVSFMVESYVDKASTAIRRGER